MKCLIKDCESDNTYLDNNSNNVDFLCFDCGFFWTFTYNNNK